MASQFHIDLRGHLLFIFYFLLEDLVAPYLRAEIELMPVVGPAI